MKTNRRVGQTECYARRLYLPVDKTARRGNGRSSYTPSQHNDIDLPDDHSGIPDNPEVEFVHPVSAGGSVKFLPAVSISPFSLIFCVFSY